MPRLDVSNRIAETLDKVGQENKIKAKSIPQQRLKTVEMVIDFYTGFNADEDFLKGLERLTTHYGKTPVEVMQTLVKTRVKSVERENINLDKLDDIETSQLKDALGNKKTRGGALYRIERCIRDIFEHNENAKEWYDKVFITPTSLQKYMLAQDLGTARYSNLSGVCNQLQDEIDKHHREHEIDDTHNAKAAIARRKKRS